ncbi:MAG: DUF4412 domain-containing protein, partial [Bacteroidetes bacterium]|nr:DUF4412 domain-containing protein [Bacteroidota bacterium]
CTGATSGNSNLADKGTLLSVFGDGDMYYEYKLTTTGNIQLISSTKMYVSSSGKIRVETSMAKNTAGDKPLSFVLIGSSDKPNESILIDDENKTYTVNHFNRDSVASLEKVQSVATKIGEDKILGYNCVHARVISNKNLGGFFKTTDTLDIWRSNDVPMQGRFKSIMNSIEAKTGNFMYSAIVAEQLKQMGCDGFMVKMAIKSKRTAITEELAKAEHKSLPASMFVVPAEYKEDKNGLL